MTQTEILRFNQMLDKDHTDEKDVERTALFVILIRNDELFSMINYIYDFEDRSIIPECLENSDLNLSYETTSLIKLAFNLYNGYPADVMETFSYLNKVNAKIARHAISVRFRIPIKWEEM